MATPGPPRPPDATDQPWPAPALALGFGVAGVLHGVGYGDPLHGAVALAGMAVLGATLARTSSAMVAAVGVLAEIVLSFLVGIPGIAHVIGVASGLQGAPLLALVALHDVAYASSFAVGVGLAHRLFAGRGGRFAAPTWLWLAASWALAEAAKSAWLRVDVEDWLQSQVENAWAMRLLAHLGWWPALVLCIGAAAAVGEAAARRAPRLLVIPAAVATLALLLPAPPRGELTLLEGIGALHLRDTLHLPAAWPRAGGGGQHQPLRLVLWPEEALGLRPRLVEGPGRGARLVLPLPTPTPELVLGVRAFTPGVGWRNAVTWVASDGAVVETRAKQALMPMVETRAWGIGEDVYVAGRLGPVIERDGHRYGILVCGDAFVRDRIAQARAEGAEVLLLPARDGFMADASTRDHLQRVQRLRSVEYGLPSVRASLDGEALFVAADGSVLAESGFDEPGLLMWSADAGGRDVDLWGAPLHAPPRSLARPTQEPDVAVLWTRQADDHRTRCPAGRCSWHALEDHRCGDERRKVVVLAGHGAPPTYLSHDPAALADAVACFDPELIVVDACFGASLPLLQALAARSGAQVVASPRLVPDDGLWFGATFFDPAATVAARSAAVAAPDGGPLLRGALADLAPEALQREAAALAGDALAARVRRRNPATIELDAAGLGPVLVPIEAARIRGLRPAWRGRPTR